MKGLTFCKQPHGDQANTSCRRLTDVQLAKCFTPDRSVLKQDEIAREVGRNRSMVSRILAYCGYEGFVGHDNC